MDWIEAIRIYFVQASDSSPENIIYNYQTLITGALALIAALLTIRKIDQQIKQERERQIDQLERQHRSRLAGLPFSFVEVLDYAKICWELSVKWFENWEAYQEWDRESELEFAGQLPRLPFDALRNIQALVETSDYDSAESLSELLSFAQIQNSRFTSYYRMTEETGKNNQVPHGLLIHRHNVVTICKDALELYFRAANGLRYARKQTDKIEDLPGFEGVEEFLFFVGAGTDERLRQELKKIWGRFYSTTSH